MKIYLIRHGLTEANEKHLYCGSSDIPLSADGVKGIKERAARGIYPVLIGCEAHTSGMLRTEQTFSLIYGNAPHRTDIRLRELDFGVFELRSYDELKDDPAYLEWISGDNELNRCPKGESGEDLKRRVLEVLGCYVENGKDILAVTHGGVIAAVMEILFPEKAKNRYEWQPKAGEGYIITINKENIAAPKFLDTI